MATGTSSQPLVGRYVWHWKSPAFTGNHIIDLYTLKELRPDLFDSQSTKYQTTSARKVLLMNNPIPMGDESCLWNAAVHTSTVHPQMVHDAKRAAGIPVEPMEYFQIPVEKLADYPCVKWNMPNESLMMKLRIVYNVGAFKLGLTSLLLAGDYVPFPEPEGYMSLDKMPEETLRLYKKWGDEIKAGGSPQILTYQGVPHVFVKGKIPIEGLEVIKVE